MYTSPIISLLGIWLVCKRELLIGRGSSQVRVSFMCQCKYALVHETVCIVFACAYVFVGLSVSYFSLSHAKLRFKYARNRARIVAARLVYMAVYMYSCMLWAAVCGCLCVCVSVWVCVQANCTGERPGAGLPACMRAWLCVSTCVCVSVLVHV